MLLLNLDVLATAPGGVAKLRELILTLAVRGKLVPQDSGDEPACQLLKQIRTEKDRLIAKGAIKQDKTLSPVADQEKSFSLPSGWEWSRFGDVSINRDGERIPVSSSDRERRAKIYDYYGASGVIDKIDGYLFDKSLLLIGEDGANLLNRSTPIAFFAHGKYWVNNHAHVIDATHPELLLYLALFINAISLEPYVTGTAQPKMNQAKLNSIVLAMPPLAEQTRIVTRVEELMRLCDALEAKGQLEASQHAQLVQTLLGALSASTTPDELADNWQTVATHFDLLLDRPEAIDALEQTILQLAVRGLLVHQDPTDEPSSVLRQRIRNEKDRLIKRGEIKADKPLPSIVEREKPYQLPAGWEWVRFGVLPFSARTGLDRGKHLQSSTRKYPYFKMSNILNSGGADFSNMTRVDASDEDAKKFGLEAGDFLFNTRNSRELVGKTCVIEVDPPEVTIFNNNILVTKFYGHVESRFLDIWFRSPKGRDGLEQIKSSTTNVCAIYQGNLFEYLCPLPPLAEQARIVDRAESLRRLCADLRQRLAARQTTQAHLAEALIENFA